MSSRNPVATPPQTPVAATVTSFDGTLIRYDIYDTASASALLIIPGFWRDRRYPSMIRLARFLNDSGYRTAVMDGRGHGESGGTFGFNLHEHEDVAAVARDLLGRCGTLSSITLIGFSYGGAIAISTIARHPDLPIASALLISPVADFQMIAPRLNPFAMHRHLAFGQVLKRPRFAWGARRSAKRRAVEDIRNVHVPVCLVHVKDDWLIAHQHSIALYEAANEPKEFHLLDIEGNYHADRIFNVAAESVEPIVRNFLERYTPR